MDLAEVKENLESQLHLAEIKYYKLEGAVEIITALQRQDTEEQQDTEETTD